MTTNSAQKNIPRQPVSIWLILAAVALLLLIVAVLSVRNYHREKRYQSQILSEKGAALIRAVEAGARTGMMGMMWGGKQVQSLLEETGRLPHVLYLSIVDSSGRVLADSDPQKVGRLLRPGFSLQRLAPGASPRWHMVVLPDGRRAFEVYRFFRPFPKDAQRWHQRMSDMMKRRGMGHMPENDWCFGPNSRAKRQIILVGLDPTPFESARREDIRNTLVVSAVLLLLGVGGFMALFWAQSYRATKRQLQDTSAFADEVVTSLPVGLIATDRQGRIAFVNAAAGNIGGFDAESIRGRRPEEVLPKVLCRLIAAADNGDTVLEREVECRFADDRRVPLSVSASRIVSEAGHFVGHILILRDLGEVKRLQDEIRQKEKLAALGSLSAGVAHEIRNPLSSIKGLASYFGQKFAAGSSDREAAEVMVREVERLNRVVSELLDFARPSELSRRRTDLADVLRHSVRLVQQDARMHGIGIRLSIAENLPPLSLDPDRFSQCLLNLYLNAIEAMADGGRLTVAAQAAADGGVQISVTDTGMGIPEENRSKIFDPYFTTKTTGTGLGLAIVYKIVEAHGGTISIEDAPRGGTRFTVYLPPQLPQGEKSNP